LAVQRLVGLKESVEQRRDGIYGAAGVVDHLIDRESLGAYYRLKDDAPFLND
jgi:hypothetical protein